VTPAAGHGHRGAQSARPLEGIRIVVPTLGTRIASLGRALDSLTAQREDLPAHLPLTVAVVVPTDRTVARGRAQAAGAEILDDPGSFAGAINLGLHGGGGLLGWLNDDDELLPGALARIATALLDDDRAVAAFGQCWYVDADDRPLWLSAHGRWAPAILGWGPDLVPQPGMLIRAEAWQEVGGLAADLDFAVDLDLLLRLRRLGRLHYLPSPVARFRWQEGTKSGSERADALLEARRGKWAHAPGPGRALLPLTEPVVRWASHRAARRLSSGRPLPG